MLIKSESPKFRSKDDRAKHPSSVQFEVGANSHIHLVPYTESSRGLGSKLYTSIIKHFVQVLIKRERQHTLAYAKAVRNKHGRK